MGLSWPGGVGRCHAGAALLSSVERIEQRLAGEGADGPGRGAGFRKVFLLQGGPGVAATAFG